jgi:hypothetical protein
MKQFSRILAFIRRLEDAGLSYQTAAYREGALSVVVRVPGQYWEVDFLDDGEIDIERFASNGHIDDESVLEELFAQFSAEEPAGHDTKNRE